MKKKILSIILAMTCIFASGCSTTNGNGTAGADGKSAYQVWLDAGNSGSEADFLEWLKGDKGDSGENGKSAYELYCEKYSYTGTEEEWLEALLSGTLSQNKAGISANRAFMLKLKIVFGKSQLFESVL